MSGEKPAPEQRPPRQRKLPHLSIHDLLCKEDALGRKFYFMPDGRAVCGRRKKKKNRVVEDEACLGVPTRFGPCRVHGAGAGAPMKSGGRYSRTLKKWRRGFERALNDKELLDTRREIALMDTLLEKLVGRLEQGDSPSWREDLRTTYAALDEAVRKRKHEAVGPLMKQLGKLIEDGAEIAQLAGDVNRELERRAKRADKVVELELRREEKMTVGQVSAVLASFMEVLRDTLDADSLRRVVPRLRLVMGQGGVDSDPNGRVKVPGESAA